MPQLMLAGLIARRKEVARQLEVAQDTVITLSASLRVLDARIKRHRPNSDISVMRAPPLSLPSGRDQRGPIIRPLFAVLRAASEPLSLHALTLQIMALRGLDCGDRRAVRNASHQVRMALANQRRNGVVRLLEKKTGSAAWEIVR